MASKSDVFDKMNKFLDQEESDSFIYDLSQTSFDDRSFKTGQETSENEVIDLVNFGASKGARKKKGKRIPSADLKVTETLDLTNSPFEISPKKKSRRAADKFALNNKELETIIVGTDERSNDGEKNELNKNASSLETDKSKEEVEAVIESTQTERPAKRSGRGRQVKVVIPKVPKTRKLSLKKALLVTSAVVPKLPSPSPKPAPKPSSTRTQPNVNVSMSAPQQYTPPTRSNHVDLTGDVYLTDKHSSAPLFQKMATESNPVEETADENEDEEAFKLNVNINNKIKRFSYRLNQKFLDLYKLIAEQEAVPVSTIFLYNGEKRIDIDDSPHSAGCKISTILTCRKVELNGIALKQEKKKNQIEIKLQSNKWKRPVTIKMSKLDNFKTAVEILCEEVEFKPEQISLRFDGDPVELTETPIDLEFEGGEILDCLVKE